MNKLFVNTGLFSILALLLIVPIVAITMAGFNPTASGTSEVLSAQDRAVETFRENSAANETLPIELQEIIKQVEIEMAKEAAESAGVGDLEIGN
ncbi:MAG: hypothetical protein KatS3mg101_0120 [Patescibacteria group bacterium]|nr:MAG: hypothetical protein KatS3mg101_0120 [Patescibacteria group bacterium]